jgi:5-methyltetrahydropteroyltriglutamate--homocysteine methyltransferase
VLEARTDQFVLEFASRELSEIDLWPQWAPDRELGAGLIDVKSFYPEAPEDVARRIRAVLKYVRPEKLMINPDCGFGWSPRGMCNQKLQSMAAGARLVREELTGVREHPERELQGSLSS